MQAICTKYFGPSNVKGSRVKAYSESGLSVTISYPREKSGQDVDFEAVKAFCSKFPGWGPASNYHAGAIKGGYAWVSLNR